jgi:hypothetical protein
VSLIGRAKKQKIVLGQDYVTERLRVLLPGGKEGMRDGAAAEAGAEAVSQEAVAAVAAVAGLGGGHEDDEHVPASGGAGYRVHRVAAHGEDCREYTYQQIEECFSQPNALACQQMLGWAVGQTAPAREPELQVLCYSHALRSAADDAALTRVPSSAPTPTAHPLRSHSTTSRPTSRPGDR